MRKILLCVLILIICSGFVGAVDFGSYGPLPSNAIDGKEVRGSPWPTYVEPMEIPIKNKENKIIRYEYECGENTDKKGQKVSKDTKCKCITGYASDNWDTQLILKKVDERGTSCGPVPRIRTTADVKSYGAYMDSGCKKRYQSQRTDAIFDKEQNKCDCVVKDRQGVDRWQRSYYGFRCIAKAFKKKSDGSVIYPLKPIDEDIVAKCDITRARCFAEAYSNECYDGYSKCLGNPDIVDELSTNCDIKRTGGSSNYGWTIGGQDATSTKGGQIISNCGFSFTSPNTWRIGVISIKGYPAEIQAEKGTKAPKIITDIPHYKYGTDLFDTGKAPVIIGGTNLDSNVVVAGYAEILITGTDQITFTATNSNNPLIYDSYIYLPNQDPYLPLIFVTENKKVTINKDINGKKTFKFNNGGVFTVNDKDSHILEVHSFNIPPGSPATLVYTNEKGLTEFSLSDGGQLTTSKEAGHAIIQADRLIKGAINYYVFSLNPDPIEGAYDEWGYQIYRDFDDLIITPWADITEGHDDKNVLIYIIEKSNLGKRYVCASKVRSIIQFGDTDAQRLLLDVDNNWANIEGNNAETGFYWDKFVEVYDKSGTSSSIVNDAAQAALYGVRKKKGYTGRGGAVQNRDGGTGFFQNLFN